MQRTLPIFRTRKDPVVRTLGSILLSAPVATALALSLLGLGREEAPRPPAVAQVRAADPHPIMTRAIVQPAYLVPRAATPISGDMVPVVFASSPAVKRGMAGDASAPFSRRTAVRQDPPEARGWRIEILRDAAFAGGLRITSGDRAISLAGIEMLDTQCHRIDGLDEPCAARAATRLELLVRGRTLSCRVFDAPQGETPPALCRADKIDLAEDLVRNGLARRLDL